MPGTKNWSLSTKQDFTVSAGPESHCYEFDNAASIIRIQYLPENSCLLKKIDFCIGLEDLDVLINLLNSAKNDINESRDRYSR